MREALALLETDPALAEWFAEQQAMDDGMRRALRSIQPPEGLRSSILQQAKVVVRPAPRSFRLRSWLLAAAGIAVAAGAAIFFVTTEGRVRTAQIQSEIPRLTVGHQHSFHSPEMNFGAMRQWLADQGAPSQFTIPGGLASAKGASCEVVSIGRAKISLLCFNLGNGRIVHFYVADRAALADAPAEGKPVFQQMGDVAVARWSQGNESYFLAERGDIQSVGGLL